MYQIITVHEPSGSCYYQDDAESIWWVNAFSDPLPASKDEIDRATGYKSFESEPFETLEGLKSVLKAIACQRVEQVLAARQAAVTA